MSFMSWVTWLEGVIPQASGRMCGLPPAIVSAGWQSAKFGHFGGQNTEATPYPSITAFRRCIGNYGLPNSVLGSVSQDICRQALFQIGPFMVELFTAVGFANGPRTWSRSGSGCHQPRGSPRRHTFNEPTFSGRPEARGRICSRCPTAHRLWNMTALVFSQQGLSASPPFRAPWHRPAAQEHNAIGSNAEIERWKTEPAGLLQRASVEHGQARRRASGSTGTAHDGW